MDCSPMLKAVDPAGFEPAASCCFVARSGIAKQAIFRADLWALGP